MDTNTTPPTPPSAPSTKPVHLTILIKKLPTITYSEFHTYWTHTFPKTWLAVPSVQKHVLKYRQFHVDEVVSEGLKAAGLPISEWDGGVEVWATDVGSLMEVFQDPKYIEEVVPEEDKFILRSEVKMMVGWDDNVDVAGKQA